MQIGGVSTESNALRVGAAEPLGPRVTTLYVSGISSPDLRLDAKHYQAEFEIAKARVAGSGFDVKPVSELATAFVPGRTKLVTVNHPGAGAPYLRAHDAFTARLDSDRYIAKSVMREYTTYLLSEGQILTPSSGRNLGPVAYVGRKLAGYGMTDIVRLEPRKPADRYYLLAYLMTPTAQALIRRGRTGTTVDHLSPRDLLEVPVVWPDSTIRRRFARAIKSAEDDLDSARLTLDVLEARLHSELGLPAISPSAPRENVDARSFTVLASELGLRLDSEFYDPEVAQSRDLLSKAGGRPIGEMAQLRLLGRYKRYYVPGGYGRPILSGRQLLQLRPVNLQYISDRSFGDPERFVLHRGWTIFTCDGRAEEALGSPSYVSSYWDGWLASNHVLRAIPRDGVSPGFLYLAMRSPFVQSQLKSRATGSVVDAIDPASVADVVLPAGEDNWMRTLGGKAEDAWEMVAEALRRTDGAVRDLDKMIKCRYEAGGRGEALSRPLESDLRAPAVAASLTRPDQGA